MKNQTLHHYLHAYTITQFSFGQLQLFAHCLKWRDQRGVWLKLINEITQKWWMTIQNPQEMSENFSFPSFALIIDNKHTCFRIFNHFPQFCKKGRNIGGSRGWNNYFHQRHFAQLTISENENLCWNLKHFIKEEIFIPFTSVKSSFII